jgi:hypothetical protein
MGKDISGLFRKPFIGQDLLAATDHALCDADVEGENDQ